MSKECNATGKTIDALASFGYFVVSNDSGVVVKTDANISKTDEDSSAFSITKLYERGYKIEAKRQGMELLSSGKSSFSLLVSMARIYEAEGDYRGATLFYIDALNFEPKNESANYALARPYYLQKKSKQAMRQAKIALSIDGLESKNIKDLMEKIDQMKDMSNE
jgi:tetratricopeptide (TPR) repeat protein